jgi:putative membrane protein
MADYYTWIKAAHIISVMILIGGMLTNGFLFRNVTPGTPDGDRVLDAAVTFNRAFIGTALAVVWIAGLTLVYLGAFHKDGWFIAKFVLVFVLSGIHGAQTGRLSKMRQNPAAPVPAFFRNSAAITLALVIIVVCLVTIKPF